MSTFFPGRQSCYGNITNALSALLDKDRAPTTPYLLPTRPGPPSPQLEEEQDSPRKQVGLVLFDASEAQECSEVGKGGRRKEGEMEGKMYDMYYHYSVV